ncbi:MAG TPA: 50S ribosomal protein L23 [Thermoanaerobaculia bacterium]|nr:50S ribosomal protein L23 [Thermoanaerobaculia bacterium]
MRIQDVIRRPLITEKSTELRDTGVVAFEVDPRANKIQIKKAIEAQFQRKVSAVRVARFAGKERRQGRFKGRRPEWKKAYVRLAAGEKPIEFFEGM